MFGKIKGKLSSIFSKSEDEIFDEDGIIEEKPVEEISDEKEIIEDTSVPRDKSRGFFSRVFSKKNKEEQDQEELTQLEEDMIEEAPEEEKKAIKEKKVIPKKIIEKRKKEVEKAIELEEIEEKKVTKIQKAKEVEKAIELEEIEETPQEILEDDEDTNLNDEEVLEEIKVEKENTVGFFSKTFGKLTSKKISDDDFSKIWVELEIFLLEINIAFEIVQRIEEKLRETVVDEKFNRFSLSEKIREVMIEEVRKVMISKEANLLEEINKINAKGEIARIVVLGVNGTGKTTTIAKFVHYLQKNNKSLVVAAADTFRAAAVEQLDEHSKKLGFKLIQHKGGSDPAAVAYDAIEHAKARKLDVVIVDTAGRMPNNSNLMQELAKIERITKADINLFIGDSISGNDLVEQIELFDKVVGITGMILTKTDTDERPGSIVTAAFTIDKPIYYLGIGQGYDDLIKFDATLVAEKLFELNEED